jgi:hypothetical protein
MLALAETSMGGLELFERDDWLMATRQPLAIVQHLSEVDT